MAKKKDFNKTHPELREGEVFIANIFPDRKSIGDDNRTDVECIGWKSKRVGKKAYDINGQHMEDTLPVFAQRSELQKAGVNTDRM